MNENRLPVWLITGCSTGIGREIALAALNKGYRVVVTARNSKTVEDLCAAYPERALAVDLDVTKPDQIKAAIEAAHRAFGGIDVLVNNAGYGYLAALEEGEDEQIRAMFETNFFGPLAVIKAVLPDMRKQGKGYIINISSQAGLMSNPGTAYYSSTKFALEGMTEGLCRELAPFGVRVTAVEPGPFRTDFSGRSLKQIQSTINDYDDTVGARRAMITAIHGTAPGDPRRAGEAIVDLFELDEPPLQLLLGRPVYDAYRKKLAGVIASLERWKSVTLAADFPPEELEAERRAAGGGE
jgi:NAD(P)-dependent dehydrogenase (short-subunit alcohol dehydrogenase family)